MHLLRLPLRCPINAWGLDGDKGAIGVTAAVVRLLVPLSVSGRHAEAVVATAAGCRDVTDLRERLTAAAGRLGAVGLRVDRRKAGIRVAKAKLATRSRDACDTAQ